MNRQTIIRKLEEEVKQYNLLLKEYGARYDKLDCDHWPENLDHMMIERVATIYGQMKATNQCLSFLKE